MLGEKLPILFTIRDVPGDRIEQNELDEYPDGHFYACQENTWMDSTVWEIYVEKLLKFVIDKIRNSSSRITGDTAKEKRLRPINSTIVAWKSLKPQTIIRSFKKTILVFPEMTVLIYPFSILSSPILSIFCT
ncbi:hypothetical protein PHMEG_0003783 [Phytophthora megakarya]|uniref:DDE-1 domain-containing protein n=1 Tax=Phytophthora megakarya TaxID=4795 RepID=A0A225WX64_9STRA|nr:hypothetical protein PHMEG_0003783 [Phytophthora megakarya]